MIPFLVFLVFSFFSFADIPKESKQLVLVVTQDWDSSFGMAQCFEKDEKGVFVKATRIRAAVVGEKGLGWGLGLHEDDQKGPIKQEGDLKSVAGIFRFRNTFGLRVAYTKFPFIQITLDHFAIDDINSKHYNTIQDIKEVNKDWTSAEEMSVYKIRYQYGIEIMHNLPVRSVENGSCIFLHVWYHPLQSTKGCIAMDIEVIKHMLAWLDPEKQPVFVQLPISEYESKKHLWDLPDFELMEN